MGTTISKPPGPITMIDQSETTTISKPPGPITMIDQSETTTINKPPGPITMIDQSEILSRSQVQLITLYFGSAQLCCDFYQQR